MVVRVADEGLYVDVAGEGADSVPRTRRHLVVRALHAGFDALGGQPRGLEVVCANRIPHGRGLGSSAAAIVAGLVAARALVLGGEETLDDAALLGLAAELEGHPDNVAACLLGGLTLAWTPAEGPATGGAAAGHPGAAAGRLRAGRAPRRRRGRASCCPSRCRTRTPPATPAGPRCSCTRSPPTPGCCWPATEDRLHQPYRAAALPRTAGLVEALRADGVPAVVSGAGPAVLAFAGPADDLDLVRAARLVGARRWRSTRPAPSCWRSTRSPRSDGGNTRIAASCCRCGSPASRLHATSRPRVRSRRGRRFIAS